MAWSFICPTEIRAFDRRIQEFETRTASVVFCSTDSEYVLRAWNHTSEEDGGLGNVHVPLLSDRNHQVAKDYGVLIEGEGVAQRAMFFIDPRGVVRQVTANDANVGRSVDEARRLLDALEFTDDFGEGCPIDWKKGEAGLKMGKESVEKAKRPAHRRTNTWSGWLGRNQNGNLAQAADQQQAQQSIPQRQVPPQSPPQSPRLQQMQQRPQSIYLGPMNNLSATSSNGKVGPFQ